MEISSYKANTGKKKRQRDICRGIYRNRHKNRYLCEETTYKNGYDTRND